MLKKLFNKNTKVSMMSQCYTGFTLAEVLIVLGIIGVVAAMVIPTIAKTYEKISTVAKVKKTYATISNAVNLYLAEEGYNDVQAWASSYNSFDCKNAFAGVEKKLRVIKRRYQNETITNIDWLPETSKLLDGTTNPENWAGVNKMAGGSGYSCHYLLQDGTILRVDIPDSFRQSGEISFDVNGIKGPNRIGKDQFPIGLGVYNNSNSAYKKVHPYYSEDSAAQTDGGLCAIRNNGVCNPNDGKSPTAYVLQHSKLPDLKALGYPE